MTDTTMTGITTDDLRTRLATATRLVEEAGRMAIAMRPAAGAPAATLKGAQDWLTEADGAVERFLDTALAEAFPADGFLGEEGGRRAHGSTQGFLTWVVDPIDGTANYARGSARFCVSLGLMAGGDALLGVVAAPALGEIFAAARGLGATRNGTPIRAAATTDLACATVELGWSRRRPDAAFQAMLADVMATGSAIRLGGSGALGLMDVACGRTDAYAELHINLWDVAAGLAILAEAGARVSPFTAGSGLTLGNPILAAAPGVAGALARAIGPQPLGLGPLGLPADWG
jgi:myo-inositol-1(or 4)-monophosphatase